MFDTNQQPTNERPKFPNPYEAFAQIEKMKDPEVIKKIAKERADMKAAIAAAPTYNIRSQLRYRLNHGVYQYDDLIDQKSVIESINKLIDKKEEIIYGHTKIAYIDENGNVCREVTV